MKRVLVEYIRAQLPQFQLEDLGCLTEESVDYPDYAAKVAEAVGRGEGKGILVCGSGIGMCIAANKVPGVRAAEVWDMTSARLSREHNDANIVCLGSRLLGTQVGCDIIQTWLTTAYLGGRHEGRVQKIRELEKKFGAKK